MSDGDYTPLWDVPDELPTDADDPRWLAYTEDMYQLVCDEVAIDVGWVPHGTFDGFFRCLIVHTDDWDSPLWVFETRNKKAALAWIKMATRLVG